MSKAAMRVAVLADIHGNLPALDAVVPAFDGPFEPSGLPTNPPDAYFTWCAAKIGQAHRDRLAGLPLSITLDIGGLGPVAFCHGTARDDNEFILVDNPVRHYQAAFAGIPEQTVVVGHTHMP